MKKLFKATLKIAGLLTIGGAVAGYKDHLNNKKEGRKTRTLYEDGIKRGLDWMCGMAAIMVFWPVYLLIAICVKSRYGCPVFFKQERVGREGKYFNLFKFKTMLEPHTRDGKKLTDAERLQCIQDGVDILSDEERLTKLGRFLRASSLDELPEAINIIRGDMSVIGPRPLPKIYLPYYTNEEIRRHNVRPGLSGLAQVNGRNTVKWDEKFRYDISYVDNVSFMSDVKIIIKTVVVALRHKDIGQGEERPESFCTVREREWGEKE